MKILIFLTENLQNNVDSTNVLDYISTLTPIFPRFSAVGGTKVSDHPVYIYTYVYTYMVAVDSYSSMATISTLA